jgi:protein-S-isoprenylcysteine O-methyltransferase Ste14
MRSWLSEWLRVAAVVALLGSVLWLLAERDVSLPALLRSAVWGLVVWVWGGLVWIALQYGQGREDRREQRGQDAGVVFESHGASRGPIASN